MWYQIKGLDEKRCMTSRYLQKSFPGRNGQGRTVFLPLPSPSLHWHCIPLFSSAGEDSAVKRGKEGEGRKRGEREKGERTERARAREGSERGERERGPSWRVMMDRGSRMEKLLVVGY